MMLYPPVGDLVDKVGSSYLLVNLIAERARNIVDAMDFEDSHIEKKPVSIAIEEVFSGKLSIK
ncbi:MAG: DNA-directed RNA polymerase subunit omega [Clostridiales bacterium]|jgi:DNA-directed RNA polymerase subunit omega|nr:DNA-directed RNA polymerase subunit omega [Clostridiales bacterium]